jgi:hypothetical protein
VLETGLFLDLAHYVVVASAGGAEIRARAHSPGAI